MVSSRALKPGRLEEVLGPPVAGQGRPVHPGHPRSPSQATDRVEQQPAHPHPPGPRLHVTGLEHPDRPLCTADAESETWRGRSRTPPGRACPPAPAAIVVRPGRGEPPGQPGGLGPVAGVPPAAEPPRWVDQAAHELVGQLAEATEVPGRGRPHRLHRSPSPARRVPGRGQDRSSRSWSTRLRMVRRPRVEAS